LAQEEEVVFMVVLQAPLFLVLTEEVEEAPVPFKRAYLDLHRSLLLALQVATAVAKLLQEIDKT